MSTGLLVLSFIANKYKQIAIQLHLTIHNIRSGIQWAIMKVILNNLPLPTRNPYWRGRLGTIDLLIKTGCFVREKNIVSLWEVSSWSEQISTRRSTVLILLLQLGFPASTHRNLIHTEWSWDLVHILGAKRVGLKSGAKLVPCRYLPYFSWGLCGLILLGGF